MAFTPCRGFFYKTSPSGGGGEGFYSVSGLQAEEILILGVRVEEQEVTAPVVTLDNLRILYSFGSAIGNISVVGSILLGSADVAVGDGLKTVTSFYESAKQSDSPVNVTGPGGVGWKMYITSLTISEPDLDFHIQPFVIGGSIAEPL